MMATVTTLSHRAKPERTGLAHWMARVPKECDRATRHFDPDAVHDLRVALRRCRSMAAGLMELDSDPAWGKMRKEGGKLFRCLGTLRDTQVLSDWVKKLSADGDPVGTKLLEVLGKQERQDKARAAQAIEDFDRKAWRKWSRRLPERARRVPLDGLAFQHLALQRWTEAYDLHRRAARSRSRVAYHRLRIGLKRFRYTIENFLPRRHAEWGPNLKCLQDLLGEVHDLDVLRGTLPEAGEVLDAAARERWQARIEQERRPRLDEYRSKMAGRNSLWIVWRAGLPEGKRLESAALAKLSAWASFLDPDFVHAQHVAGLALELFDGLREARAHEVFREGRARRVLHAAALLHDVGRAEGERGHHKASYRLIRDLPAPFGWTDEEMKWVALAARYHRGAEPHAKHEGYAMFSASEQKSIAWLAGVLRLADGLDQSHDGRITRLKAESTGEAVVVRALGYTHDQGSAIQVANKKHLLEAMCGRPVVVQPPEASSALSAD